MKAIGAFLVLLIAADEPPLRIREVYVPYPEFQKLTKENPDGVVMALEEYRGLVLKALGNVKKMEEEPPPLPPLESVIVSASYSGTLQGKTARIQASLQVRVTSDGWVRCDLGAPIPGLGLVLVDDQPGWIILDSPRQAKGKKAAAQRAYLLLKGKGEHQVVFVYSLEAEENEDRWSIQGQLFPAASSRFELEVPGQVEAKAEPAFLKAIPLKDSTRLVLAAGTAPRFRIEWRRKKALGEKDLYLAAEHRVSFALRRRNPVFDWKAAVTVARRKTEILTFTEPPGARVLEVEGPRLHSWEKTGDGLRVILNEPVLGKVELQFSGVLEEAGARFVLGPPLLSGSYSNTGYLALYHPSNVKLSVEEGTQVSETSMDEAKFPAIFSQEESPGQQCRIFRLFAFTAQDGRISASLSDLPEAFETHATFLARIDEGGAILEGIARISVREGRMYRFLFNLPAPWELVSLTEVVPKGKSGSGLSFEESQENRTVELTLQKACLEGASLEVQLRLEHGAFGEDRDWDQKPFQIGLPAFPGAGRSRTDLGIAIPPSMYALMADLPGWRSLDPDEVKRLGLDAAAPTGSRAGNLVAGLTTRDADPRLSFTLVHRPPRGEYRAVLHLLALERAIRVRVDLRLTAVDRPLEVLLFRLPASAGPSAVILGAGIKEIETDPATGTRTVRFSTPWLGTRQFRIEYEGQHEPGTQVAFPAMEVDSGDEGTFGRERFIVLQSQGPVEIQTNPGPGASPVDVDDLPDFAEPWKGGRVLTAYQIHATGDPGTFSTVVHERAPVLLRLARELQLTTVLGEEGVSRTRAEIVLAYSRKQLFQVLLPAEAECLAVSVNGEPIRALIPVPSTGAMSGRILFSIPLPAQTYATVVMTYQRPGASRFNGVNPLGSWGSWRESAPVFPEIPVKETVWSIYYPDGYVFSIRDGNLRAVDSRFQEPFASFADSFFGRIFRGELPAFTALQEDHPVGARVRIPDLTPEEAQGAETGDSGPQVQGRLNPREVAAPVARLKPRSVAPLYHLIPEGRMVEAAKIGGNGVVELFYASQRWLGFSKKTVFFGTVLAGLFLFCKRKRTFWITNISGLALGTLIPLVLGWRSPLLLIPFCEGLAALAILGALLSVLKWIFARLGARISSRKNVTREAVQVGTVLLACLWWGAAYSGESPGEAPVKDDPLQPAIPLDGVLIPYDPEVIPGIGFPEPGGSVFVPSKKFRELWDLAYPEEKKAEDPPREIVLGNAQYVLRLEGESSRITATVSVSILGDRWVALPLPFDRAQISRIRVDGRDVGVGQSGVGSQKIPFVEFKGRGRRVLEIDLVGTVDRELGEYRISSRLLAGPAATLRAELPDGAKVEARKSPIPGQARGDRLPLLVRPEAGKTVATVDLGGAPGLELIWYFPKIEGQTGSQVESLSYSSFQLLDEGYLVDRRERIRVTGRPVDQIEFQVFGDWRITDVSGVDISEWSLASTEGNPGTEKLQIFFSGPISSADLRIRGRARMGDSAPAATLRLAGAARQETYMGLHHGGRRRFSPDVLSGMQRSSRQELLRAFKIPDGELPDRIYSLYGSGEGESLAAEGLRGDVVIDTDVVSLVDLDRLVVSVRSRYTVTGPGPLRHEVQIPKGWSVRTVRCAALRDWEVVPGDPADRLVLNFNERAPSGTEMTWSAESEFPSLPESLELPPLNSLAAGMQSVRERARWLVAADDQLDVAVRDAGRRVPISLDAIARWIQLPSQASYRFALRSTRAEAEATEAPLSLGITRRSSQLSATVVSFARLAEDFLQVNVRVIFRIRFAGRDRFRLGLPPGAELLTFQTRNQRSLDVRRAGDPAVTELDVLLQSPVAGTHTLDLSYRIRREESTNPVMLPIQVFDGTDRLEEVDQYVGVLQTAANFISGTEQNGLVRVEAESLPYLPEGVSPGSLQPTFRATQLDWRLGLAEEVIEVTEGIAAIVELAELSTIIGIDGTVRTRAMYTVRNRTLQFLVVDLPEGADLWGVTLNGKPVAVGKSTDAAGGDGSGLRIPVEHVGAASLNLEVEIQYEERRLDLPALWGSGILRAPRVRDTQVVETLWNVHFPQEYVVSMSGGNVREVAASARSARKVRNLLDQLEKISKAASESDSQRVRDQAAQEMLRLEQALGDNLAELEEMNQSAMERAQAGRVGQAALEEQWRMNTAIIQKSRKSQIDLREARKSREKEKEQKAPPSKQEQAFLDTGNFLDNEWRGGRKARPMEPEPAEPPAPGRLGLEVLLEEIPFQGLKGKRLAGRAAEVEISAPEDVEKDRGLKPIPELAVGAAPALEDPTEPKGCLPYTFLRSGGDAEITLSYTQRGAIHRLGALVVLILAGALLAWRQIARRSAERQA